MQTERQRKIHQLKTWPPEYKDCISGIKTFDIRPHDRDFKIGDTLRLQCYTPDNGYTGEEQDFQITYTQKGWGLPDTHIALGIVALELS